MARPITFLLDEDDEKAVHAALATRQTLDHRAFGEVILPEGESDTAGLLLGEICRDWLESHGS